MVSEMDDVSKNGYYESPLGCDDIDWFVDEIKKLKNKVALYFKHTNKDNIVTEKEEDYYRKINICQFSEKKIESEKVRDLCHSTADYRGPALQKCNINVTQKQSKFIPFKFHNSSKYDGHLLFKQLVDNKNDKVNIDNIPRTIENKYFKYIWMYMIYR